MSLMIKKCGAVFLAFLMLSSEITLMAAGEQPVGIENSIYEVLARSNMRAEPSTDGAWIMTIPQGAIVRCLDNDDGAEFCRITYEDTTGYIYSGCINQVTDPLIISEAMSHYITDGEADEIQEAAAFGALGSFTGMGGLVQSFSEPSESAESVRIETLVNANLRGTPSIEGSKLLTVPKGSMVSVLDEGENGFTHVSYQGRQGYIYTRLLDLEDIASAIDSGITNTLEVPEMQNAGAETLNGDALLMSQSGIFRNSNMSSQVYVEVEDVAASNMIEVQTMVTSASQAEAAISNITSDGVNYEISRRANMRRTPSVEGAWITTIPVGADIVKIGETTDGYTMVQYDGIVGYVLEGCITDRVDLSRLGSEPVLFTITAYCSCRICCGNYSPEVTGGVSHTATGTVPQQGRTIAVDPKVIPYGTSVHIDGMGDFIAEDCGGSIRQNHIDVYFESHEAAVLFGTKRLYVSINHE